MRGRPWTIADRTGGQIDDVFDQLRGHLPGLIIERLEVTHRADNDNVYFIGDQHHFDLMQIDTRPDGQPPFLIENGGRHETTDTSEAVSIIQTWLEQHRRTYAAEDNKF
jgi:hypothetical protein